MSFLRKVIILFIIVVNTYGFEQNGVKDGNMKISISLISEQDDNKYNTMDFYSQFGYFYKDNIEFIFGLQLEVFREELYFTLSPGFNYYFYNMPIFTPYIGGQFFYKNTTYEYIREKKGDKFYMGGHLFISENIALTPEFGITYYDFDEKKGTYFNTLLTYFF